MRNQRAHVIFIVEVSSWTLVERRFGIKLCDALKELQRKITGPTGGAITSKDIDELYRNLKKKPKTTAVVPVRQARLPASILKVLGRAVAQEDEDEWSWSAWRRSKRSQRQRH